MNDQPCEKCQQPVEQMMQASNPFYTCSTVGCRFHIAVADLGPPVASRVLNGWIIVPLGANKIQVTNPTDDFRVTIPKSAPLWEFFRALLANPKE